MIVRSATWKPTLLVLLALTGCYYPMRAKIDDAVCDISKHPFDIHKMEAADQRPLMPSAEEETLKQTAYRAEDDGKPGGRFDPFEDLKKVQSPVRIPPDLLPGGPPTKLDLGKTPAQRREALRREFQPLRPPGPDYEGVPGPNGHPLTLAELQRIGMSSSPLIKAAVAAIEVARGNAVQAGIMPNPIMGFEVDTFGTTGGAGYPGAYMDQLIKTAGKLRLARAVAAMTLRESEVALRRAQMDLATKIRTYYFQLLVARESMRINRILVAFTNSVYEVQAGQMRGGELTSAAYEPMYLRVLANTALTNLVFARNNYTATWKQLAATLGLPGMPLTQVAGHVDMPVPIFDFDKVWKHVGQNHTDVLTADIELQESRFSLLLAQVQPYPDVDVRFLIQKDYTGPPNAIAPSIAVSIPVPVWNRNQGGIAAAQANVIQMGEGPLRVRNELYYRLSDSFNRYRTFRENLGIFRYKILPDLLRVYNAIYARYQNEGPVLPPGPAVAPAAPPGVPVQPLLPAFQTNVPGINDVVVAQQTLSASVGNYIINLGAMWQAVVDVTDLVQTNDMFRMGEERLPTEEVPTLPDLQQLKPLLPTHPCSPLPDPRLRGGDGTWPQAVPTKNNPTMPSAGSAAVKPLTTPPAIVRDSRPAEQMPVSHLPRKDGVPDAMPPIDPRLLEPPPLMPARP